MNSIKEISSKVMYEFKAAKFVGFKQAFFGIDKSNLDNLKSNVMNDWNSTIVNLRDGASKMNTTNNLDLIADRFGKSKMDDLIYNSDYMLTSTYVDIATNEMMDIDSDDAVLDPSNVKLRKQAQKRYDRLNAKQSEIMNSRAPICKVSKDDGLITISSMLNAKPTTSQDAEYIINQLANK